MTASAPLEAPEPLSGDDVLHFDQADPAVSVPWEALWPEPDSELDSCDYGESPHNDGSPGTADPVHPDASASAR